MPTELISTSGFDPTYPAYPIIAIFAMVLVSMPAYWQFKAGNVGTSLYITWTFIGCLIYTTNSILWYGNLQEHSMFWCDLTTKIQIGFSVGLPAASLLINRRLYKISTVQQVHISKSDSRKELCLELAIGLGIPVIVMVLHVVNQGHRYNVVENIGCWPETYTTPVAIATLYTWPIGIAMVSFVYCSLSIRAFFKQRRAFLEVLQTSGSGLNVNRYFRLMALAATELCFGLPFAIWVLVASVSNDGVSPWISWANTHWDFNRVEYMPWAILMLYPQTYIDLNITRYSLPAGGFLFFIYLGLSGESGQFWERRLDSVKRLFGFTPKSDVAPQSTWSGQPGISVNIQSQVHSHGRGLTQIGTTTSASSMGKRDSLDFGIDSLSFTPDASSATSSSNVDEKHDGLSEKDEPLPAPAPHDIV
ncbi:a-factor receptor [Tulasnella sp. 330]|nr:a-factor receptor [Tulasnella sp. 330]